MDKKHKPRLECVNWDKKQPCRLQKRGNGHCVSRKVLTRSTTCLVWDGLNKAIECLRKGYEVRLTGRDGAAAIRLFPCVEPDMKTMFVAAQTMKGFRESIADKRVKLTWCSKDLTEKAARRFNKEQTNEGHVTPDTMVECPKCGHNFRVGKKLG